ncbi:hypothetical protein CsSME_00019810 [Camellia sinensis var. sinensis]
MIENIARCWRVLSGQDNWKNLLDPLDIYLCCYIIHYGEMASSRYSRKNLFAKVGLAIGNSYHYTPTKYLYSTLSVDVPEEFLLEPFSMEACCKEWNWIGYIVVATDQGKVALARRDILVAWRGTIQAL